ncbi:response regulator transcription factor [Exiguobacterium acetylicum]|jgi:DNA-binding response OmpR family regulator|uniref:response regulator transcription factor n=1 Tax=Exiguobacterium TaxID=33986 RepID=UPI000450B16D|nr:MULTISPECIES: response regulator transcription factor [Exiguobacterium]EZP59573.1 Transcriptional regulator [Exiguobacterium sp. RIT341]KQS39682.1 two-component system response regulator [Exiguobacterium sp. Leaf196]MDQ6467744.1 response regulator transcription factor [Exiguobacterium acetylicum]HAZ39218.1 DNA-binding response regulator [Exiguobacterium sp.]
MHTILLVEDDVKIATLLKELLERYDFKVVVEDGRGDVIATYEETNPDVILLDVNLPKFDGFYWCRQLRMKTRAPILFISARVGEMDQVMALEYGADDYIVKPFQGAVVIAKIKSQIRRAYGTLSNEADERTVTKEGVTLYLDRYIVEYGEQSIELSKKEGLILEMLLTASPRIVSRGDLLERIWDDEAFVDENTLNVNITRVRKRLAEIGVAGLETVRGVGYKLVLEP